MRVGERDTLLVSGVGLQRLTRARRVEGVEKGEPGSLRELAETGDKTRIQLVQSRGKIFPQYGGAEEGSEESAEEEEEDDSEEGDDDEDDFGSDVTSESGEVQYDDDSEDE